MKRFFLYLIAVLYVVAGFNHLIHPGIYLRIIPPYLPFHHLLNVVAGLAEIALGLLIIPKSTRNLASWCLAILLILLFPANIQMAIDYYEQKHALFWVSLLRLPLQALLIWWALSYSNLYNKQVKKL